MKFARQNYTSELQIKKNTENLPYFLLTKDILMVK